MRPKGTRNGCLILEKLTVFFFLSFSYNKYCSKETGIQKPDSCSSLFNQQLLKYWNSGWERDFVSFFFLFVMADKLWYYLPASHSTWNLFSLFKHSEVLYSSDMRNFIASLHLIQKRAKRSIGGLAWRPACRQWAGGRRTEGGVCVFCLSTFRSHFWPWVQGFRCLREIRVSVIDEFVPASAGGSLWFPRTRSHWAELSSETSAMGRKSNTGFLRFSKNVWGKPSFFFLDFRGFHQPANVQKLRSNKMSFLHGFSRPCRKVLSFFLSFLAMRLQVSEPGAVSTMAFLTLLLSPWRRHGNLSSERAQRGSISTRLITAHTRLPAYCLLVFCPSLY